jgi:hypothetical protein
MSFLEEVAADERYDARFALAKARSATRFGDRLLSLAATSQRGRMFAAAALRQARIARSWLGIYGVLAGQTRKKG